MRSEPGDLFAKLTDKVRAPLDTASALARSLRIDLYLVGGAVRDLLLGQELRDLDLVWTGGLAPRRVAEAFGTALEAEIDYHPEFLTASVIISSGLRIDIGRARAESYPAAAALPTVRPSGLSEDLRRRDFSVNAMAVSLAAPRKLIDPLGGAGDLALRQLRILHEESFRDDPTRILRGCELAVRRDLVFEAVTSERIDAAVESGYLALLSGTRVRHELERLLGSPQRAAAGAKWLRELGVDRALHPEFRLASDDLARLERLEAWPEATGESGDAPSEGFWVVALCALLWGRPRTIRRRLGDWLHLRRAERNWLESVPERLAALLAETPPVESSLEVMATLHSELSGAELRLVRLLAGQPVRQRLRAIAELAEINLGISGADLTAAGIAPGSRLGDALDATLAARRRREISAEGELAFALAWLASGEEPDAR